jgi:hypothetical protein
MGKRSGVQFGDSMVPGSEVKTFNGVPGLSKKMDRNQESGIISERIEIKRPLNLWTLNL